MSTLKKTKHFIPWRTHKWFMKKKADTHTHMTVAYPRGQHLSVSVRPFVVSSAPITHCSTSKPPLSSSLLRFLWLTDLRWQIRLVDSLCDVTPSLADRQTAVTCWETLCCCQKLCAPLQWLISPSLPPGQWGDTAGLAVVGIATLEGEYVCSVHILVRA